jgi:uncharacterized protein YndB with AHSA1/START domain
MPSFEHSAVAAAPAEEVWKLLYDPTRFPDWWTGVATVDPEPSQADEPSGADEPVRYTMYPEGYPDFPMPQRLSTDRQGRCVVVSCLVSDISFVWRLEPSDDGRATRITAHVDLPAAEADRLTGQRQVIEASLRRLADLAALAAHG